jgi:hypothetical protein
VFSVRLLKVGLMLSTAVLVAAKAPTFPVPRPGAKVVRALGCRYARLRRVAVVEQAGALFRCVIHPVGGLQEVQAEEWSLSR